MLGKTGSGECWPKEWDDAGEGLRVYLVSRWCSPIPKRCFRGTEIVVTRRVVAKVKSKILIPTIRRATGSVDETVHAATSSTSEELRGKYVTAIVRARTDWPR